MRKRLTPAVIRLAFIAAVLGTFFALTSPALAAPPVLVSASHVDRHPAATWTLPPGVKAQVAEVATSPATSLTKRATDLWIADIGRRQPRRLFRTSMPDRAGVVSRRVANRVHE
jgi:hypothetical protein